MSGNSFGTVFRVTTFGESHGAALGVVILHKLPHKWFQRVIQVFVLIGAIRLLWMGLAALVK